MLRNALFIVISQSGRSPDLVAATKSARAAGARTIAIVNATSSPVAAAAEFVVPIEAGRGALRRGDKDRDRLDGRW